MASQLGITIERVVRARPRGRAAHLDALMVVGAAVLVLELGLIDRHGTHLLVGLVAVIGTAIALGPGPATSGLAAGAGTSLVGPAMAIGAEVPVALACLQVAAYLVAGGLIIVPASRALRSPATPASHVLGPPPPAFPTELTEPLTCREVEIQRLAASGIPVDGIAARLYLSPNTVKTHLTHAYAKLGVRGRSDAVRAALHFGCLSPADICPHRFAGSDAESPVPVRSDHPQR